MSLPTSILARRSDMISYTICKLHGMSCRYQQVFSSPSANAMYSDMDNLCDFFAFSTFALNFCMCNSIGPGVCSTRLRMIRQRFIRASEYVLYFSSLTNGSPMPAVPIGRRHNMLIVVVIRLRVNSLLSFTAFVQLRNASPNYKKNRVGSLSDIQIWSKRSWR